MGGAKFCAVGARIKKRVSMHGIALNIDNDLKTFSYIIPCGISSRGINSVSKNSEGLFQLKNLDLCCQRSIKRIENLGSLMLDSNMSPEITSTPTSNVQHMSPCCEETIKLHGANNPMMVCASVSK